MSRASDNTVFARLHQAFPNLSFKQYEPLSKHTYFKIGGPAEVFLAVTDATVLTDVVRFAGKNQIPITLLGGASNVLVLDKGISGLVIHNKTSAIDILDTHVTVDSGVLTNVLVRKAIDAGLGGLEYFMGLPGTVGGAVVNNSHYKHQLFGEYVTQVTVVTPSGEKKTYTHDELQFSYDHSILQTTKDVIISIELDLKHVDKQSLESIALEATRYRAETQPLGLPSSGCMFKNAAIPPEKRDQFGGKESIGAGWLIDHAGLKGMRIGDAQVSEKHANFIVNLGKATAEQVFELSTLVQRRVFEKFGVQLDREVFLL